MNNNLTFDSFIKDYNELSENEIRNLSNQLILSTDCFTKKELYDKIENYLKIKQDIIKENETKSNLNPFQNYQPQLLIQDIDRTEILFWRIFRNKSIFNEIFSNFIFKELFSYEFIVGIDYVLNKFNNAEEIIKDKIKSNNYILRNFKETEKVIQFIKKNKKENNQFYNQLFTKTNERLNKYSEFSTLKSDFQYSNSDYWLPILIKNNNLVSLEEYIKIFNIKNNFNFDIANSFDYGSYKSFKTYFYLIEKELIDENTQLQIASFKFHMDLFKKNFNFNNLLKFYKYLFKYLKFSHSIPSHKFSNDGDFNILKENKYSNLILELEEIDSKQFTKQQLNTTIEELLFQCSLSPNKYLRSTIYKLYKMILAVFKYYCCSNFNGVKFFSKRKDNKYYLYFKDMEFLYQHFSKKSINYYLYFLEDFIKISAKSIQEKKILIKDALLKSETSEIKYNNLLIQYCFEFNNLELFKFIIELIPTILNSKIHLIFKSIKSKEILEYCFENYQIHFFQDDNSNWVHFQSIEILKYYIVLMKKLNRKFLKIKDLSNLKSNRNALEILKILIENEEIGFLEIDRNLKINTILDLISGVKDQEFVIEFFKMWINYFKSSFINKLEIDLYFKKRMYRVVEWILRNYSTKDLIKIMETENKKGETIYIYLHGETSNIGFEFTKTSLLESLCFCGRSSTVFEILNNFPSLQYGFIKGDNLFEANFLQYQYLKWLEYIVKNNLNKSNNQFFNTNLNNIIYEILKNSSEKGSIFIYKKLILLNESILKKKSKKKTNNNNSIFYSSRLKKLIRISIDLNNQELNYLLLNIINLEKKEINQLKDKEKFKNKFDFKN